MEVDLTSVANSTDESGRQILLAVPGLGPWSVDIYYLMALRRPDAWLQGDLALAIALREVKHLTALPTMNEQQLLSRDWAPWRSVAARILWTHYLASRGQYLPRPVTNTSSMAVSDMRGDLRQRRHPVRTDAGVAGDA